MTTKTTDEVKEEKEDAPEPNEVKDVTEVKEEEKEEKKASTKAIKTEVRPSVRLGFMGGCIEKIEKFPEVGDLVEGEAMAIENSELYVDLKPFGTGIIYGREFLTARDIIKKINTGDMITAKVVEKENEDGYVELSLKEARQAIIWGEIEELLKSREPVSIQPKDANKGGLIIEWKGIQGFLPASQLGPDHYPRVEDGDKVKIMEELKKLVGTSLSLAVLAASPKENKLIFTEKGTEQKERSEIVEKYNIGDEVSGEVTGIVDFGVFLRLEEGLEGLVHISELDWGLVDDPRQMFQVGEKIAAKVIEINNGKISLSIKALKENPWNMAKEKYKKGDEVSGVIIKYNKYGALASIEEGVAGLIHVSEFENEETLRGALELGKTYSFKITLFDPKDQKMALSHKHTDTTKEKK